MSEDSPSVAAGRRSLGGLVFTAAAVIAIVVLLSVWFGTMFFMKQGRSAAGERMQVELVVCEAAYPLLQARVETMGLGEPVYAEGDGTWQLTATFTGDEATDRRIPDVLATTGRFAVELEGEEVVHSGHITEFVPQVDYYASPELLLDLDREGATLLLDAMKRDGGATLQYTIDGQVVSQRAAVPPIEDGKIELQPADARTRQGVATMAEWSVVLPHGPLPCTARVASVQPAPR